MPKELELLKEWKERLGLYDWTIELMSNVDPDDLDEDADGDVEYIESTKCAVIKIVDPKLRKAALRKFNFELCLVHELLHCKLSLLMDGDDWEIGFQPRYLHQIVDDLARAFVAAKYDSKTENTINDKDVIECAMKEESPTEAKSKDEAVWVRYRKDPDIRVCSKCGWAIVVNGTKFDHCPGCGSKMTGCIKGE